MNKCVYWFGRSLIITGAVALLLAFVSDLLSLGGEAGFGDKQIALLVTGSFSLLVGIFFITKPGIKFLMEWLDPTAADCQSIPLDTFHQKAHFVLYSAAWFGLVTGTLEICYRLYNKITANTVINLSRHFYWMTPLTYLVLFICTGLLLLLFGLLIPKISSFVVVTFIFTFIGIMCVYYSSPTLYFYAILLLAVGISYQLARFLSRRSCLFFRSITTTLPWMITGVVASAAFFLGFWN